MSFLCIWFNIVLGGVQNRRYILKLLFFSTTLQLFIFHSMKKEICFFSNLLSIVLTNSPKSILFSRMSVVRRKPRLHSLLILLIFFFCSSSYLRSPAPYHLGQLTRYNAVWPWCSVSPLPISVRAASSNENNNSVEL